jgi:beta-glucosidase
MLLVRLMLGEFDTDHPYANAPAEPVVNCFAHQRLAHGAVRDAMVLLKNAGVLPLVPVAGSRIAVLGPFADELVEDWYSGTMPYRSTVADGLRNALALDDVTVVAGSAVDRVVLGVDGVGAIGLGESGPALRVGGPAEEFAVFDWGAGVVTLRSTSLRRCVTATEDGALAVGPRRPGGWEVRETFTLERPDGDPDADMVLLRHVATGRHVSADADGVRLADEAQATQLRVTVVRSAQEQARELVAGCAAAIVVAGNDPHINGRETQDRPFLGLPDAQEALVRLTGELVPDTVLVLMSSYPIAATWADEHLPAIIWTSHGGQETGNALAEVLLGDHSPSGRLPQTWYRDESDLPDILDYDIIGSQATYQYFPGTPLYPFGHGLSYTSFAHDPPELVDPEIDPEDPVVIELAVRNTGPRTGTDVIQCYVHAIRPRHERPIRKLAGFARVRLDPGVSDLVRIELDAKALAFWDVVTGSAVIDPGEYDIQIGRSCTDVTGTARLTVRGERPSARPITGLTVRAADFDAQSGTTLVDVDRAEGDAVARESDEGAAWLVFRAAELPASATMSVGVSRTESGPAWLEFRGDAWDGPLLASLTVPCTGGRYAWTTVSARMRAEPGIADLYLVLRGAQRISGFRVTAEQRSDRSA